MCYAKYSLVVPINQWHFNLPRLDGNANGLLVQLLIKRYGIFVLYPYTLHVYLGKEQEKDATERFYKWHTDF